MGTLPFKMLTEGHALLILWGLRLKISIGVLTLISSISPHLSFAQSAPDEVDQSVKVQPRIAPTEQIMRERLERFVGDEEKLIVTQVVDATLLLITQDLRGLKVHQISPIAIRGVTVHAPLSPTLSDWIELRLTGLLHNQSGLQVTHCSICRRQRTKINQGSWLFSQGLIKSEELQAIANKTGIQSFLDLNVRWSVDESVVSIAARLLSPSGAVIWREDYSSESLIKPAIRGNPASNPPRAGNYQKMKKQLQLETASTLIELEAGAGMRSGQGLMGFVAHASVGLSEFFGTNNRWQWALSAGLSASRSRYFFDINGQLRYRLFTPSPLSEESKPQQLAQGFWVKGYGGIPFSFLPAGYSLGAGLQYITSLQLGGSFDFQYAFGFENEALGGPSATLNLVYVH